MAINVMTWVWTHSHSRNGARLVMLAIADSADDTGRNAWPSVRTLMTKANLSERAVQSAIKDLITLGELRVQWNKGPHGSNLYSIIMTTPADSAPPQHLHPADSAGEETSIEPDATAQDPPQILHPADSAPPQILRQTPADSAPKPSLTRPTKKTSSSSRRTRGTRIPDDFAMTPEMIAWGQEHFPSLNGEAITAEFVDYWRAVPGAKGIKLDWVATWRNQVRRAAERASHSSPPGQHQNGSTNAAQQRMVQSLHVIEEMRRLDKAEANGTHIPDLLPLPPGRTT